MYPDVTSEVLAKELRDAPSCDFVELADVVDRGLTVSSFDVTGRSGVTSC